MTALIITLLMNGHPLRHHVVGPVVLFETPAACLENMAVRTQQVVTNKPPGTIVSAYCVPATPVVPPR